MPDKYDHLAKLKKLLDDGVITDGEFVEEKAKILAGQNSAWTAADDQAEESEPVAVQLDIDDGGTADRRSGPSAREAHRSPLREPESEPYKPWGMEENSFCMLLHLSQFAGMVVPMAGLIMPIVMWLSEKDNSAKVNAHGAAVVNWIISSIIYAVISLVACFIFIGFLMLLALIVCDIVFTILGAVKANDGKIWTYPMSIRFFKVDEEADDDADRRDFEAGLA